MQILGLPLLDIAVIVVYFAVVIYIGIRSMKNIKNTEDYFLGGRKFGKAISTFAAFGQATSADSAVTTTTMVSTNGAAGIGMGLINGVAAMPIFWMITMWYRRMRYTSLAEYFEERFGSRSMAGFYAIAQTFMFMLVAAVGFIAMSKTVVAIAEKPVAALTQVETQERVRALELKDLQSRDYRLLDETSREKLEVLSKENPQRSFSYINQKYLTVGIAFVILLCAVVGGLEGAFITEVIQGTFIIILTLMLIPFAMIKINAKYGKTGIMGTFDAFHENLPDSFFKILGSPNVPNFTWYYIVAFGILAAANIAVGANQLTSAGSAKDDETARMGFVTGLFIKRYCYVIWGFVAMMTMLLFSSEVSDADYVWGLATRELLPTGLVGLMIACLMAALMSTVVALMLTSSALITNSIYKPLVPNKTEGHYVFAGRIFCGIYFIGAVSVTLAMDDIFTLFVFMTGFNSIIAATFWIGMVWRRATKAAAWSSIGVTFIFTLALPLLIPLFPGVRTNPDLLKLTEGYTVSNTYTAKQVDLDERNEAITVWNALDARGEAKGARPNELTMGQDFLKEDYIAPKPIFWQNDIANIGEKNAEGKGMLKVELVALQMAGFDLTKNKYALNETIAVVARIAVPFGIIILVSLLTPMEEKRRLDLFYGKIRTPAVSDHAKDAEAMAILAAEPTRTDHMKMFPNSNWEFRKWTRSDWRGHGVVGIGVLGLTILMFLLVTLGK